VKATFHGHACFLLEGDGKRVVIDPFLTGNPVADIGPQELPRLDAVLLSHGHGDHLGDAVALSKRDNATIVATYELAQFCADQGATTHAMHIGGAHAFPFGRVKLVPAFHGGRVDGDPTGKYTTNPCGIVVTMGGGGTSVYHTGDTGLTVEMQLLAGRVDQMLVPIGDNYTMGVEDAVRAVEFVKPKTVIPMHYNTWDVIRADPEEFRRLVGSRAVVVILSPGESHTLTSL
jgi:L-ascorbate metabolism protein UlaG (beta-lactamase superfamily)